MLRKVLWTALATVMTSVATALAYNAAVSLWRTMTDEDPPQSRLAGWLVHGPVKSRVLRLLQENV